MYMEIPSNWINCDGCGLAASPAHIAERLSRLELATRFRPIHINVLFVAAAPLVPPEDDFYRPPRSREFFDPFMEAVEIPRSGSRTHAGEDPPETNAARLVEFQRHGYYLSYLSECPLSTEDDAVNSAIARLGPTLLRRVRFNYKPTHIAILGGNLSPLRDVFELAGMASTLLSILGMPGAGDAASAARFREALASRSHRENPASEYDSIDVNQP
jgi:hypothetical protein